MHLRNHRQLDLDQRMEAQQAGDAQAADRFRQASTSRPPAVGFALETDSTFPPAHNPIRPLIA